MLKRKAAEFTSHPVGSAVISVVHFVTFALRRFFSERLHNAVASLTYSTLLAIVPLLVIAFAILSSFPAFDAIKERMRALFFQAVVPEAGDTISAYLSSFTENASNLTAAGVVALAVSAVLLLSTIEDTLNRVWHAKRSRPLAVRFLIFWAVLTLGPMLIGASIALSTDVVTFARSVNLGDLGIASDTSRWWSPIFASLIGLVISILGFSVLFVLVPVRRVRVRDALIGAVFAAFAFEGLSWGFNTFFTSGSSYETIYGAVAAVPVFLVWVYASWMVIILGAVLAASYPDWAQSRQELSDVTPGPVMRMEVALEILAQFHRQAQIGGALDEDVLLERTPFIARDEILEDLCCAGFIVESDEGKMVLARDLHSATLFDLSRDLDLSVARNDATGAALPKAMTAGFSYDVSALHNTLTRLSVAEAEIMSTPIAALIKARSS